MTYANHPKIIKNFTRDSWFKRGTVTLKRYSYGNIQGRDVKTLINTIVIAKRFFIHEVTQINISKYGLGEIALEGSLIVHSEIPFDVSEIDGKKIITEVYYNGRKYRISEVGDWSRWGHYIYVLNLFNEDKEYV